MSKFSIGDKVMLSPDSMWVNGYSRNVESANPLNIEGAITYVFDDTYKIKWGNGRINSCYTDDDLIPTVAKQPEQECPHAVIEELSAQVENLEQLVSEQAARIRQVDAVLANFARLTKYFSEEGSGKLPNAKIDDDVVDAILEYFKGISEQAFKQVNEYTLEDWTQAVREGWKFETRSGDIIGVEGIDDSDATYYPVCSDSAWLRMNGCEFGDEESGLDIIKRVI